MSAISREHRTATSRQPKYLRIYEDLAARIRSGEHTPGTPLPSQRELSESYHVTLMTLRQALKLLEEEGLVETRHGTGTFVATPRFAYDLGHLQSFAQDMMLQGTPVQTKILSSRTVTAPPAVSARLGLRGGHRASAIRRLRLIDGRPVVLQDSYLPLQVGRHVDVRALETRSLYAVLAEDLGVVVNRATEAIRPVVLDAEQATVLDRDHGSAAIISQRVSFADDDQPVIDDVAVLAGDSVLITANRNREGLQLSYTLSEDHQ